VPRAGQLVEVEGGAIHYVEQGPRDAPPVVLIHGLSGQLQHFDYGVAEALAGEFRVISVDRPGCGYSRRDDPALADPGAQARMIDAALDRLGVGRAVIVGHSLGGAVALAMALDRPGWVGALALICPATQLQTETPEAFRGLLIRTGWLRRAVAHTVAVPLAAATARKVLEMVFRPDPVPENFIIRGGGALGLRPKAFITASEDILALQAAAPGLAARYGEDLKAPGGVLYGGADAILSPSAHGRTMQPHGLTFEAVEGAGHMLPVSAPDACAAFIRRIAAQAGQGG